jgi:molybdopterin-guanine dinucleotide biosynthesis protein
MMSIVVAGEASFVGKTSMVERLLPRLDGWSAIKITTVKGESACGRKKNACGICGTLKAPYEIIKDAETLYKKGTDTARFKSAGAERVIWIRSKAGALGEAIKKVFDMLGDSRGVIIESTSVLKYFDPDAVIFIFRNGKREIKISEKKDNRWARGLKALIDDE